MKSKPKRKLKNKYSSSRVKSQRNSEIENKVLQQPNSARNDYYKYSESWVSPDYLGSKFQSFKSVQDFGCSNESNSLQRTQEIVLSHDLKSQSKYSKEYLDSLMSNGTTPTSQNSKW